MTTIDRNPRRQTERLVVVLGAGLSKAANNAMPLTDELGEAVRGRLSPEDQARLPHREFGDGYFEQWVSYLAEEQPHLSEDRLLEARALLYRVTRAVRDVLEEAQFQALTARPPGWLMRLVSVLHFSRATVVNMNYDNLVECAVEGHTRQRGADHGYEHRRVTEDDVLCGVPRRADLLRQRDTAARSVAFKPKFVALGTPGPVRTFRLLKPHGSLSWYSVPGDVTGSTLQRWELPGTFGHPVAQDQQDRQRALPGMEPFIVPPAALKGGYLASAVVRQIWQWAFQALAEADRVVLVGYSLPLADQSFAGMLSQALDGRAVPIEVVNLDPGPVLAHLERLGLDADPAHALAGPSCTQAWVERETDRQARRLAERIAQTDELQGDEAIVVAHRGATERVLSATVVGDDFVALLPGEGEQFSGHVGARALLDSLERVKRVVVSKGEEKLPVVGVQWTSPTLAQRSLHLIPVGEW